MSLALGALMLALLVPVALALSASTLREWVVSPERIRPHLLERWREEDQRNTK